MRLSSQCCMADVLYVVRLQHTASCNVCWLQNMRKCCIHISCVIFTWQLATTVTVSIWVLQGAASRAQRYRGYCLLQWVQPGGLCHDEPVLHRPRLLQIHVLQVSASQPSVVSVCITEPGRHGCILEGFTASLNMLTKCNPQGAFSDLRTSPDLNVVCAGLIGLRRRSKAV